ncbi:MAG: spore maturation protein A [Oscillospiraceae bacterium]|nr:spore maturation protein A [Oscillospiraceae bacterium]
MVMSWVWTGILAISVVCAIVLGRGAQLGAAVLSGAQSGITLTISIAGSICLWSGVGKLMERAGISQKLSKLMRPLLNRLFPTSKRDEILSQKLSANISANILGLGNAATPMGIQAAKRLVDPRRPGLATDELCRLIVLNTASIQLIPGNVAAVRASLGAGTPFDILPAVWITSICSTSLGLAAAYLMGKVWRNA